MEIKKRAYALYRVSTAGQIDVTQNDIPMQKKSCHEFAEEHGWQIKKEFTELGVSGYKKSADERDAIISLRQAAENKEFDVLLVFMFDRLGRREDETPFVVQWFDQHGIEVWSVKEGQQRFDSHADYLINFMRYWAAEGESEKTSIRTKTRLGQLTQDGKYTGGGFPYGYRLADRGRVNKRNKSVFDLEVDPEEAEIVRLIFRKYVFEGYGSQRLSHWLHEQNITRSDGRNFPNTTIHNMITNQLYTGIIKNGDTVSEVIPELQIIEPNVFEQAQVIMKDRTTTRDKVPLNSKSRALLVGRVYCAHCGHRLTLTTSGGRRLRKDGSVAPARERYQCHFRVRHPGDCDGQSGYGVTKLDDVIDKLVRMKFAQIKTASKGEVLSQQREQDIELSQKKINRLSRQLLDKQKELADLKAEIIKVIRGESTWSQDLLNQIIDETNDAISALDISISEEKIKLEELRDTAKALQDEYDQILTWADMYDQASTAGKKMILSQFLKAVYVGAGYNIDVEFNISFEQFQNYLAT